MRPILIRFATAALLCPLALVATAGPAQACTTLRPIAHRGGTERYVENTRDSFRDASNVGTNFWETDVQFTSDGVPVIMHDATVDRTTTGTGAVADLTYAQWQQLRTDDDQPVPSLADFVNDSAVDGSLAFIELKTEPTDAQWDAFLATLAGRPGSASRFAITSFDTATLSAAKLKAPAYARGLIQSVGDADPATITPYATLLLKHHDAITSARVTKWVGAGLKVYAWTVDDTSEMDRMTWYPLSGVITDTPAAYLKWQKANPC